MSPKLPVVSGKQIVSTLESIQFSIVSHSPPAELDVDNFLRLIIK